MDTTGKSFSEFWGWAAEKGLMNENTANSFSSPVKQIISILDDWENVDITTIDQDDLFQRFGNIRGKDFKPESLNQYFRRFQNARKVYLDYVTDPINWKYKGQSASRKQRNTKTKKIDKQSDFGTSARQNSSSISMVDYPFPLRENCLVRLKLPADLKMVDIERLLTFMRTLVVDNEEKA